MCYKRTELTIIGMSIRADILSNSWKGFTKFTSLKKKPPKGYTRPEERTNIQTTTRRDHVRPEIWTKIGKAAQNRENQDWAREEPKLENARKMMENLKNARRKLERPMAPKMPCKRQKSITKVVTKQNSAPEENSKTMYNCMESRESTRQRAESQTEKHEDHIAGEGCPSMSHYIQVHKFIPMPQAMKIPDAKAAVDKEWKKTSRRSQHGI